jgi:hypothetical protein
LRYFLGIQVHRDRKKKLLQILQRGYVNMILERFGMQNSTPVYTNVSVVKEPDTGIFVIFFQGHWW